MLGTHHMVAGMIENRSGWASRSTEYIRQEAMTRRIRRMKTIAPYESNLPTLSRKRAGVAYWALIVPEIAGTFKAE